MYTHLKTRLDPRAPNQDCAAGAPVADPAREAQWSRSCAHESSQGGFRLIRAPGHFSSRRVGDRRSGDHNFGGLPAA